ncbi:MAG: alpha/beta hydrolase family protein [Candidatus Sulfotelmatobacter sp.]|jgi:S-formylglutathione hydrolase FrmB
MTYPSLRALTIFLYATVSVALFAPLPVAAQSRIDCGAMNSKILKHPVRYCVYVPDSYDADASKTPRQDYPVLYYLHGLGGNEQQLFNDGGWTLLDGLRRKHKISDFLIVAPDGGKTFYINSADGKTRYSDFFLQEFIPYIEGKYHVSKARSGRAITGISMGGYGALRFAFSHPELFAAVSAQSPALTTESPKEIDTSMQSDPSRAKLMIDVFGDPINLAHWRENDPLVLARQNATNLRGLAIYFNCGQEDNYGFEKGAEVLQDELKKEKVKHEYRSYPGDHSAEYFTSHFDEVIEFHSRAFGPAK